MDVDAYLSRIGYEGSRASSAATLVALQNAHLLTVPFESLDQHFGVRISLEPPSPTGGSPSRPGEVIGYRGDAVLDRPIADAHDWRRTLSEQLGVVVA